MTLIAQSPGVGAHRAGPANGAGQSRQIEIWFSILARKLLRRGNFTSKTALRIKIERFIAYFNETMAKPFRWTMQAKPLAG